MKKQLIEKAFARVNDDPELSAHDNELLYYDWPNMAEHLQWVATAPKAEIMDWLSSLEEADAD